MTVQELINQLNAVEDKETKQVYAYIGSKEGVQEDINEIDCVDALDDRVDLNLYNLR